MLTNDISFEQLGPVFFGALSRAMNHLQSPYLMLCAGMKCTTLDPPLHSPYWDFINLSQQCIASCVYLCCVLIRGSR